MNLVNMALDPALLDGVPGDPIMSDEEMQVFLDAFAVSGFTGGINWYRNFSRNWEIIGNYEQHIYQRHAGDLRRLRHGAKVSLIGGTCERP